MLLDTHTWLWWALGDAARFSAQRIKEIQQAEHAGDLLLASVSIWEIAMLDGNGRIALNGHCLHWLQQAIRQTHVDVIPTTPTIAVDATRLPGHFHADPADQLIVATARARNATLLTVDPKILDFAKHGHVRALPLT